MQNEKFCFLIYLEDQPTSSRECKLTLYSDENLDHSCSTELVAFFSFSYTHFQ